MVKGQYLVYERASRDEERFFLSIAREVVDEVEEPKSWRREGAATPNEHAGGRPVEYGFRPMLMILLLMVYHRKEYREMESHLKSNPQLVEELGLQRAPSKSSIHGAVSRMGIDLLVKLNEAVVARFKKIGEELERST